MPTLSSPSLARPQALERPEVRTPRHILYLFDQLKNLEGGAERSLLQIIQQLPRDRYRASIATFCRPSDVSFLTNFSCPIHLLPLRSAVGWRSLNAALLIREIIRCQQVAIVQTFFASSDLFGGVVAKWSGCPVLISSRRDMGFQRQGKHNIAYRLVGPAFDRVHTVSDAVRDYTIRQDRLPPDRVVTIANGVDTERIAAAFDPSFREKNGLQNASHVIVDVGSVKPVKGYEVLIEAAAIVRNRIPGAVFGIAGPIQDQAYYAHLQQLIADRKLTGTVRFFGNLEPVFPLLHASDIFCHLSLTDGLSNALLEAMATGLPCVISAVGGNPEVVEPEGNGFLIPPGDAESAAGLLIRLIEDCDLRRRLGQRSRAIIEERFTADQMVRKFVALYDQLLAPLDTKQ